VPQDAAALPPDAIYSCAHIAKMYALEAIALMEARRKLKAVLAGAKESEGDNTAELERTIQEELAEASKVSGTSPGSGGQMCTCGNQLMPDAKFCRKCGAPAPGTAGGSTHATPEASAAQAGKELVDEGKPNWELMRKWLEVAADGNKDKLDSTLSLLNEIQSGAHASQPSEVLDDESLEEAAEKVHEEWRQKKHSEMLALGVTLPVPQWKRLPDEEYKEWSAALSEDVLAKVHCYCPPQPTNPSFPHLNMRGEGMKGDSAVHWCDIDQPYEYLPESWKATNRQYAVRAPRPPHAASTSAS